MKKWTAPALGALLLTAYFVCACTPEQTEDPSQALQAQVDEMQTQIDELGQKLEEMQGALDALGQENEALREQAGDFEWWRAAPYGAFVSLADAYQLGWLTQDDLTRIAAIQNALYAQEAPDPLPLDETAARAIRETRAYALRTNERQPRASYRDVSIDCYYGCYDGLYAAMISDSYTGYHAALWEETIGGVTFRYRDGREISIDVDEDDPRFYELAYTDIS